MDSLKKFLLEEAEFRLREMFEVPEFTEKLVEDVAEALYNGADSILNYDEMDYIIFNELKRQGVEY